VSRRNSAFEFSKMRAVRAAATLAVESLEPRIMLNGDAISPATDDVVKWTFGDTQNNLYVLSSYSPQDANLGPIGALDPALDLVIGTRYSVTVTSYPHHPLEIIAAGATPFDDVVLLAQASNDEPNSQTAKWESDPGVNWVNDPATRSVSFTLTPELAAAMFDPASGLSPGYRCGNPYHRGFQRGGFILSSGIPAPKDAPHDGFGATFSDATPIGEVGLGSKGVAGAIETPGGVDLFRFVAPSTGLLTVTQTAAPGEGLNSLVLLYDGLRTLLNVAGGSGTESTAQVQLPVVAGNIYYIQAAGYQGSTGEYGLSLAVKPQFINSAGVQTIALDKLGSASVSDTISSPGGRDDYQFTATISGQITITQRAAPQSGIDPLLIVYNSAGILVAADNEGAGSQVSQVRFSVHTGQTYRVQAGALGLSLGAYTLTISTQDPGDSLADAVPITLSALGTATQSGRVDRDGEADYFFFVAPKTGSMTIEQDAASGSSMHVNLSVFDGSGMPLSDVTTTILAGGAIARAQFSVSEGQVYYIRAGARGSDTGVFSLFIAPSTTPQQFFNADPIALSPMGFAGVSGSIGLPGDYVMYTFTAPRSGVMEIAQDAVGGTSLDSVLSFYDASGTLLATDDDGRGVRNSFVSIAVTAGQTYHVKAAGFGDSTGQFTLTLAIDSFGNDFASASPIALDSLGAGRVLGTIGSSGDVDVFQVVASQTQSVTIRLNSDDGSTFDGELRVYDAQRNLIAADDDISGSYNSMVPLSMVGGQTYFVEVAGYRSSIGAYSLLVGNGMGDDLDHAIPFALDSAGFWTQSGWIDRSGDVNTFQFVAPVSGVLTVVQIAAPGDSFIGTVAAYDAMGILLALEEDEEVEFDCLCQDTGEEGCVCLDENGVPTSLGDNDELSSQLARFRIPVVAGETYFIQVGVVGSNTGQYVLDVGLNDPNSDEENSIPIEIAFDPSTNTAQFNGMITLPRDVEVLQFTAPASGHLVISQSAPPGSFLGSLLVTQPDTSFSVDDNAGVGGNDPQMAGKGYSRVSFDVTAGETYIVKVAGLGTSIGAFHLDFKEFPQTDQNLSVNSLDEQVTPEQMVDALLGSGNTTIQVVPGSVVYTGANNASGLFSGGSGILDSLEDGSRPFHGGIIMTNGNAVSVIGVNDNDAVSRVNGVLGSPLLDKLVRGGTLDASSLTFNFIPTVNVIQFQYVFASEEYNSFVGTPFDDVFGFFVNGTDYARVPGTGTPLAGTGQAVSVNTINHEVNSQYFIDNTFGPSGGFGHLNTQMNGLTRVLTLVAPVKAGQVNTITLSVGDTLDPQIESAVFIQGGSLQAVHELVSPPVGQAGFTQLVQTVSNHGAGSDGEGLSLAQLQFLIQQAVVNKIIKEAHLTGDFLVIPVDPVDFTLTGPNGLQIASTMGQGMSGNVPNAFYASDGVNQLLIIPNANPGQYQVELVGIGSGPSLFGASYVSASGMVTSVLLNGNLQGGSTSAVLDFQSPNGGLEQATISTASAASTSGLTATAGGSTLLTTLGVLLTQVSFPGFGTVSVQTAANTAEVGAIVPVAQSSTGNPNRASHGSVQESTDPSDPYPALLALLEALERGLREIGEKLDQYRGSTLGDLIEALETGLETVETRLEQLISILRQNTPPGMWATSKPPSHARRSEDSNPDVSPERDALPILVRPQTQPTEGRIEVPISPRAVGAQERRADAIQPESRRAGVVVPVLIAGIGLARLADRRALGLDARKWDRIPRDNGLKRRGPRGRSPGSWR
jgi:hypothetical protein